MYNLTHSRMFASKVWTDELLGLQKSNLTARQPYRAPHHVVQASTSEGLAQDLYVAARGKVEPVTYRTEGKERHHSASQVPNPLRPGSNSLSVAGSISSFSGDFDREENCRSAKHGRANSRVCNIESQNREFSINDANWDLISNLIQENCTSINHENVSDCFLNELHMLISLCHWTE